MTTGPTVAVLLAAGAGARLGRGPKALLPHGGRPLVEHVAEVLADGGCDTVVVVLGAQADRVRSEAGLKERPRRPDDAHPREAAGPRSGRVAVVVNPAWATGMASSLRAGVAAALDAGAARVVVAHVDQPGVRPDDVARLLAAHRPGRVTVSRWADAARPAPSGESMSAPSSAASPPPAREPNARRGRAHPIVLDPAVAAEAVATAIGDRGARDWLDAHADLIDVVTHPGDGRDVDTEADLDLLR
ncbi:nucleotidyltransferase family protein [Isoptericola hypogeus]|uniref:Nucleotidyltransferase family protein n=1 Tax=Isoptericola hypogeus TaxID=300179 RepID=A0ABP4UZ41_9MICO